MDQSGLVEPLSEREIEVLELMAAGLTYQDIAEQLFISPHTVKTHSRNIYAKLDVGNRTLAVGKARTLGILQSE
ncbi:MAG: helix-turn-helix transcriptional regulator [Anaerolineales bacterium]